jgi:hypothetical protein
MLLDIFVTVPSLLMTNIAWYIRVGLVLICLIALLAVAIGAIAYRFRADGDALPHRPSPAPIRL